ncbi:MAG: hypothetical protein V1817_02285 [Candidatus Micrarchaeota archaeon]
MAKVVEARINQVHSWYLPASMIYSSCSILVGLVFFLFPSASLFVALAMFWGGISILWFLFSVIMFIEFVAKKIEKIALLIPGLYVFDVIFSSVVGLIAIKDANTLTEVVQVQKDPVITVLGMIFPVIILIIAAKLYLRK